MGFFRCHIALANANIADSIQTILYETLVWVSTMAWPVSVGRLASIGECCIINPTFIGLRKHLVIGQLVFLCNFLWSPSIGKPRMDPVSLVKTTESYEVCR